MKTLELHSLTIQFSIIQNMKVPSTCDYVLRNLISSDWLQLDLVQKRKVIKSFTLASISCLRETIRFTHSSAVAHISLLTASARARSLAAIALTSCTASCTGGIFFSIQQVKRSSIRVFRSSRASLRPSENVSCVE